MAGENRSAKKHRDSSVDQIIQEIQIQVIGIKLQEKKTCYAIAGMNL
jgi:hypothetical protein